MKFTFAQRQSAVATLRELTDPDDIFACVEALMDAQGYRSLARAATLYQENEDTYLKRLRAAKKRYGHGDPDCESVLLKFEELVTEMEEDISA